MWAIGRLLLFGDSVPRSGWGFQHQERAAGWNREHRERDRLVEGLRDKEEPLLFCVGMGESIISAAAKSQV